jgi:molecular chaperone Hsp33
MRKRAFSPGVSADARGHRSLTAIEGSLPDDLVQPFRIDPFALRGRLVRLGAAIDRILSQHAYPEPVARILGEAITLAVLLAGALKYDGVFSLQTKSDGPIRLIVADVTTAGALRGYAQYDEDKLVAAGTAYSTPALLGSGYIAFTVDQGEHTDRYQGIVELAGASLADCAQHYFRQSEQLQAGIKLAVARVGGEWRAGGLMLQRVPPEGGYGVIADDVEDGWRRAMVLMSSATGEELTDPQLTPHRLLFRLFHEDGVRVFDTHALKAQCRCSRERIEGILPLFSPEELAEMQQEGLTTVTCQFCNQSYFFDADDLARLTPARLVTPR